MKTTRIKRKNGNQRRELAAIFVSCWWRRAAYNPFQFQLPF